MLKFCHIGLLFKLENESSNPVVLKFQFWVSEVHEGLSKSKTADNTSKFLLEQIWVEASKIYIYNKFPSEAKITIT